MVVKNPRDSDLFLNILQPGLGGLNATDDPSNIGDNELADVLNCVYDNGVASPRGGSEL